MKLAAICCTYLRPTTLGHLIECFRRQDYPLQYRELIILDDAGQYRNTEGEGWRLVSIPRRFHTLGEKRNACAGLVSADVEGFLIADDDDIYFPHWFSTHAAALKVGQWSRPSRVLVEHDDALREKDTGGLFHAGWAYRRDIFSRLHGYRHMNSGEDQDFSHRLLQAGVEPVDPSELAAPFLYVRHNTGSYHISYMDDDAYERLADRSAPFCEELQIGWPQDYTKLHVIRQHSYGPERSPDAGECQVELIRSCEGFDSNGPHRGMMALQRALRRRITDGLDWLTIKEPPVSRGSIPWFWHWSERSYAGWWNSQGKPFIQGPNLLFAYSDTPRVDGEECQLLDARNCRAMFCHSEWYRRLIIANRRPSNQCPIVTWPYPIESWPGEPLHDEYDLLIYCKNGHRPHLDETLQQLFPRHVRFAYGQHTRDELFEAARRSRACAYLSDDEPGGVVSQEILLAGCPTVGVYTGCPFVRNGLTGYVVERLPLGRESIHNSTDEIALQVYLDAIERAQQLRRQFVRECAAIQFSTETIVSTVLSTLSCVRTICDGNLS